MNPDVKVIACNQRVDVSAVARESRAYVLNPNIGGGSEDVEVLVRSRSGRWIGRWERMSRLKNFRLVTLPPENSLYERLVDGGVNSFTWVNVDDILARLQFACHRAEPEQQNP